MKRRTSSTRGITDLSPDKPVSVRPMRSARLHHKILGTPKVKSEPPDDPKLTSNSAQVSKPPIDVQPPVRSARASKARNQVKQSVTSLLASKAAAKTGNSLSAEKMPEDSSQSTKPSRRGKSQVNAAKMNEVTSSKPVKLPVNSTPAIKSPSRTGNSRSVDSLVNPQTSKPQRKVRSAVKDTEGNEPANKKSYESAIMPRNTRKRKAAADAKEDDELKKKAGIREAEVMLEDVNASPYFKTNSEANEKVEETSMELKEGISKEGEDKGEACKISGDDPKKRNTEGGVVCVECDVDDAPMMLELPQTTDKILLKSSTQSSLTMFSAVQGHLDRELSAALSEKNPNWSVEISEETGATVNADGIIGSPEQFAMAVKKMKEMLQALEENGPSDEAPQDLEAPEPEAAPSKADSDGPSDEVITPNHSFCHLCPEVLSSLEHKHKHLKESHPPQEESISLPVYSSIQWNHVLEEIEADATEVKGDKSEDQNTEENDESEVMESEPEQRSQEDKSDESKETGAEAKEKKVLFRCKVCGKTGQRRGMKHHVASIHGQDEKICPEHYTVTRFRCPSCRKRLFEHLADCEQHLLSCQSPRYLDRFIMEVGSDPADGPRKVDHSYELALKQAEALRRRTERVFPSRKGGSSLKRCIACSYTGTRWQVTSHHRRYHQRRAHFPCPHCEVILGSLFALKKHKSTHFDSTSGEMKPLKPYLNKMFQCKLCLFRSSYMGVVSHVTRAHPMCSRRLEVEGSFVCSTCGKGFSRQRAFRCHEWRCRRSKSTPRGLRVCSSKAVAYDDVAEYIKEVDMAGVKREEDNGLVRYDEDNLTEEERRKIVSSGIVRLEEAFPTNGFPAEMKHIFQCQDCSYISSLNGTITHRRRYHRQARHPCPYCPKQFVMKCELERHTRRIHLDADGHPTRAIKPQGSQAEGNPVFMIGNKCFQKSDRIHGWRLPHECVICGFRSHFDAVGKHVRQAHMGSSIKCCYCEKEFSSTTSRDVHERMHRKDDGSIAPIGAKSTPQETLRCEQCGLNFKKRQHLQRHMQRKHGNRTHACPLCTRSYASRSDLKVHMQQRHQENNHRQCKICQAEFTCATYLRNHMRRVHEDRPPVKCSVCGKFYKDPEALQKHSKIHRPDHQKLRFQCLVCAKTYSSEHALRDHMNLHSGDRPYACDSCPAKFMSQSSLCKHKAKHVAKEVPCPFEDCPATFHTVTEQVKHIQRCHNETYVCSRCSKIFVSQKKLLSHLCQPVARQATSYSLLKNVLGIKEEIKEEEREAESAEDAGAPEDEKVLYMCGQCDVLMSSWDEMEQHALVCGNNAAVSMESGEGHQEVLHQGVDGLIVEGTDSGDRVLSLQVEVVGSNEELE